MSMEINYQMKGKNGVKEAPSDTALSQDNKIYKKMALLDVLISPESSCKQEIFERLLVQFIPIIDYVIPPSSIFEFDRPPYRAGNTILHIAKSIGNLDVLENFIQMGADFTIKDRAGTPLLHLEADNQYNDYFNFKIDSQSIDNKRLFDMVLSAHIEYKDTDNPSDRNGISHFHLACAYNKTELVQLFLESGVSVQESVKTDSPIYPGYTPLHFAAKYCAVETVEILLKYGADTHISNSMGLNPLHLLIDEKVNTWTQLIRRRMANVEQDPRSSYPNLERFHNKIEKIMTLLLERWTQSGFGVYDSTGLSYFHVMCTMQDSSIVGQFLERHQVDLEQKVNASSALWPGYTALHFAAHFNPDTVRLLLTKGANLGAKDARGLTPFDICLNGMKITDIHSIYSLYPPWSHLRFSDGQTKLSDFIWVMQNTETFRTFLEHDVEDVNMFVPFDSPVCAGYTPLHLCVICKEIPRNWNPENVDYIFAPKQWPTYSSRISMCMSRKADVCARDARGSTPIHLAFDLQESNLIYLNLLHPIARVSNVVDERGLSVLHIASAAEDAAVVNKLLSDGSNASEATKSNGTWYVVNLDTMRGACKELYKTIVRGSTPLHVAAIVESPEVVRILMEYNADVLAKDADDMTPMERSLGTPIFGNNEDSGWIQEFRDNSMSDERTSVLEILIPRMSDLLADSRRDRMLYCYSLLKDALLSRLLKQNGESMMKILKSAGITRLHVACYAKNLQQVGEQIENGADVNARVESTSPLWPCCTPLHILMNHGYESINNIKPELVEMVNLLLGRGADVAATDATGSTPLQQIFQTYLSRRSNYILVDELLVRITDLVDMLLAHITDFAVNPANPKGLSHLHAACSRDNALVIEKLLEHGAEVNQAVDYFDHKFGGYTALHFAVAYQCEKAVYILLRHGADVNRKDVFERNPLHAAVSKIYRRPCVDLLRSLITAGANMEMRDAFGERPLEKLVKSGKFVYKQIEVFVEHNCRVNAWNPVTDEGWLAIALRVDDTQLIFETLIKSSKIKNINEEGHNAIHNVVSYEADWEEFYNDDPIEEVFISAENHAEAIKTLVELGVNIDHQDNQGKTPLHIAAQMQNITGILGLLYNGANINIADEGGKSAFLHSLELSKLGVHMSQLDTRILTAMSVHFYKLNLVGSEISSSNREVLQRIATRIRLGDAWCQECRDEFEGMKSRTIDVYSVTLNDFLFDTGAVSSYPFMLPGKREAIDKFFRSNFDKLKKEFPKLVYWLFAQHRNAAARLQLIRPAEASIDFLVGFPMPPLCSRIIFRFLSNVQLENLIASMDI